MEAGRSVRDSPISRAGRLGCSNGRVTAGDKMAALAQVLAATDQGDAHAKAALWETVYRELRAMAAQKMASEREGRTLQLGVNEKTVRRHWELAKVFLFRAIQNAPPDSAEL